MTVAATAPSATAIPLPCRTNTTTAKTIALSAKMIAMSTMTRPEVGGKHTFSGKRCTGPHFDIAVLLFGWSIKTPPTVGHAGLPPERLRRLLRSVITQCHEAKGCGQTWIKPDR